MPTRRETWFDVDHCSENTEWIELIGLDPERVLSAGLQIRAIRGRGEVAHLIGMMFDTDERGAKVLCEHDCCQSAAYRKSPFSREVFALPPRLTPTA